MYNLKNSKVALPIFFFALYRAGGSNLVYFLLFVVINQKGEKEKKGGI